MQRKLDPRVIRTRQMLRDAFISLTQKKGYDSVTIQDITDEAGLRRATFYLHYKDKEELMLSILRETFDDIKCEMHKLRIKAITPEAEFALFKVIFDHAAENADLYRAILGGYGAPTLTRYVREYLTEEFLSDFNERNGDLELVMPLDVLANYSAVIKLQMAIWWLEQGMPYSSVQMAEICAKLTLTGAQSAFVLKEKVAK